MLDQETKKRIDDLRNILVGKIPDPKSQVEQITISLIYKFMNDMDDESMSMGGVPSFFVDEYEKYSWKNIFNPRHGGAELVNLYGDAIEKVSVNPHIPQLFRDIFKNAYIPYRDPETLRLFLKTIDEFKYTHSEMLGDAFEYLLSFMGSQGDAGQFRTPRHIIDFLVEIIDPKKSEVILDPACGSAGFLVSAYKHIVKNNTKKSEGDLLSASDRNELVKNINGFDISPDMVRLALVNLYLHNFTDPKIYEYDSLTSEDRWNEYFDVILANPPFMTPKGGIRPHNRFSIASSKAEVLFTDYITEHLKPNGRAGIVVPEGIVSTQHNAFKSLRKMLVNDALVAVISLPAGVFKPYSGVKTNILILDKKLSRSTEKILFAKVSNDGFELGDQRKPIKENDLPFVASAVKQFLSGNLSVTEGENYKLVEKKEISSSDNFFLSYQRYFKTIISESVYEIVDLGDVCEIVSGQSPAGKFYNSDGDGLPFYQGKTDFGDFYLQSSNTFTSQITKRSFKGDMVMSVRAPVGPVNLTPFEICIGRGLCAIRPSEKIDLMYLFYFFRYTNPANGIDGSVFDSISRGDILKIQIPLPTIEEQKVIVEEIERDQEEISLKYAEIEALTEKIKFKICNVWE